MSTHSAQDNFEELVGVKLGKDEHLQHPKDNGNDNINENFTTVRRTGDLRAPSRATDPRPGISPGIPSEIFSNPSPSRAAFVPDSGFVFGQLRPRTPVLNSGSVSRSPRPGPSDFFAGIGELFGAKSPKLNAKPATRLEGNTPSPEDPLREAKNLLLDLDAFDAELDAKARRGGTNHSKPSRPRRIDDLDEFDAACEAKSRLGSRTKSDTSPARSIKTKPASVASQQPTSRIKQIDSEKELEDMLAATQTPDDTSAMRPQRPNDSVVKKSTRETMRRSPVSSRSPSLTLAPLVSPETDSVHVSESSSRQRAQAPDSHYESSLLGPVVFPAAGSDPFSESRYRELGLWKPLLSVRLSPLQGTRALVALSEVHAPLSLPDPGTSHSVRTVNRATSTSLDSPRSILDNSHRNLDPYTSHTALPGQVVELTPQPATVRHIIVDDQRQKKSFIQKCLACVRPMKEEEISYRDGKQIGKESVDRVNGCVIQDTTYKRRKNLIHRITGFFNRVFRPNLTMAEELKKYK